ncbi:MAG: alpha/beta fold hydrolase [Dehalococcoidia bacterium]
MLLHGLLSGEAAWRALGYVAALADSYQVVSIDALGHGRSDKPADPALHQRSQRVGDVLAVLDDLGAAQAHVVGYSMGSWQAASMALLAPTRVASLVVGGWDLVDGLKTAAPTLAKYAELAGIEPGFDALIEAARAERPELLGWITPDVEPGLRAAWDALSDLDGTAEAVAALDVPVMLWDGAEDDYHDPMETFAQERDLKFVTTPGNHASAIMDETGTARTAIRAFLDEARKA